MSGARDFTNEQDVDVAGLADRVGSISFAATIGEAGRAAVLDEVRALSGAARSGCVALRRVQLAVRS